jgi:hypothetical protein
VILFGVSPGWVGRAPSYQIAYWHRRIEAFWTQQRERLEEQRRFEEEMTHAMRMIRGRR